MLLSDQIDFELLDCCYDRDRDRPTTCLSALEHDEVEVVIDEQKKNHQSIVGSPVTRGKRITTEKTENNFVHVKFRLFPFLCLVGRQ